MSTEALPVDKNILLQFLSGSFPSALGLSPDGLWCGNHASLLAAIGLDYRIASTPVAELRSGYVSEDQEDDDPFDGYGYMVDQYEDIAIINVSGPLVTNSSWITRFFGMTGYDEVRNATLAVADNDDISAGILHIESPGGSAMGTADTGALIRQVDRELMPMYAFTSGQMTSAAYWLGAGTRRINASPMAQVASIGAVAILIEMSEMLKKEGITPTILRSGNMKARGNPYEPLTEAAFKHLNGLVQEMGQFFLSTMAEYRGVSLAALSDQAGDGREMFAKDSIGFGLVDELSSLEALVNHVSTSHNPNGERFTEGTGDQSMIRKGKTAMSPQAVALAASGGAQPAGDPPQNPPAADDQTTAPAADAGGTPPAGDPPQNPPAADAGGTPPAGDPPQNPPAADAGGTPPPDQQASVQALAAELSNAHAQLATARSEASSNATALTALQASVKGLCSIVVTATNRLQVAMNQPAEDLGHLSPQALVDKFHATNKLFTDSMPVGQQSAAGDNDNRGTGDGKGATPAQQRAAVSATRLRAS